MTVVRTFLDAGVRVQFSITNHCCRTHGSSDSGIHFTDGIISPQGNCVGLKTIR